LLIGLGRSVPSRLFLFDVWVGKYYGLLLILFFFLFFFFLFSRLTTLIPSTSIAYQSRLINLLKCLVEVRSALSSL
jgi:hypothetical protein